MVTTTNPRLPVTVSRVLDHWLKDKKPGKRIFGRNEWLYDVEGKIYIRYNGHLDRIDLASIEIDPEYRGQGVFRRILIAALAKNVSVVRIENVVNKKFAERVVKYSFPGWETRVHEQGEGVPTVDFVRRDVGKELHIVA